MFPAARKIATTNIGRVVSRPQNKQFMLSATRRTAPLAPQFLRDDHGHNYGPAPNIYSDSSEQRKYGEPPLKPGEKRLIFSWEKYAWIYTGLVILFVFVRWTRPVTSANSVEWVIEEAHHGIERPIHGRARTEVYRDVYYNKD